VALLLPASSFPYLPELCLRVVIRASVPQGSVNTPTCARCEYPNLANVQHEFCSVQSVSRGSQAVSLVLARRGSLAVSLSTPACESWPFPRQPPPSSLLGPVRPTSSGPAPSLGQPSEFQRTRVPSPGCPASPASGRFHHSPGPRPGRAPSTAPPGPPEAEPESLPDPGQRLRHRGYEHWPTKGHMVGSQSIADAFYPTRLPW
jgi:hypothetical protein